MNMATAKTRSKTRKKTSKAAPAAPEMEIASEIWGAIQQFRQRSDHFIGEIGRIEVRKSALIGEIDAMNNQANNMLRQEGTRLGIPEGTQWKVNPEGKIILGDEG
jgi:hypothetical protein